MQTPCKNLKIFNIRHKCYLNMFEGVHSWCWCKSYKFFASGGVGFKVSKSKRVGSSCLSTFSLRHVRLGPANYYLESIYAESNELPPRVKASDLTEPGTCWNLIDLMECCNMLQSDAISASMCVHVRLGKPQKAGSQSEAQCSRAWCVGQWSAACASGHQHLKASQSSLSGNSRNSVWEWDRINRFERFEMCLRFF